MKETKSQKNLPGTISITTGIIKAYNKSFNTVDVVFYNNFSGGNQFVKRVPLISMYRGMKGKLPIPGDRTVILMADEQGMKVFALGILDHDYEKSGVGKSLKQPDHTLPVGLQFPKSFPFGL